jgi:ElaB/YqjD/DUF883 family membrane-anchored ribosome-binding protein
MLSQRDFTMDTKIQLRWELAEISNRLNKLLRLHAKQGPRGSTDTEIHELRAKRDKLLSQLNSYG